MTTSQQPQSEHDFRLAKRQNLIAMGIPPYAQSFDKKNMISDLIGRTDTTLRTIEEILSAPHSIYSTA